MKTILLKNWNVMRVVRLFLGLAIMIHSLSTGEGPVAIAGAVFSLMAVFNVGCCAGSTCNIPSSKTGRSHSEITYEKIE